MSDMKHWNARNAGRRGQALVESALVTLAFVVVLIGIVDVGQVLFVHQTMVERSRSAVRYGAVRPYDATAIENMFLYDRPTAPVEENGDESDDGDREDPAPGLFGMDASMVTVNRYDVNTNEDRITLTITNYPFSFFTPFIAGEYVGKPIVTTIPYEGG